MSTKQLSSLAIVIAWILLASTLLGYSLEIDSPTLTAPALGALVIGIIGFIVVATGTDDKT